MQALQFENPFPPLSGRVLLSSDFPLPLVTANSIWRTRAFTGADGKPQANTYMVMDAKEYKAVVAGVIWAKYPGFSIPGQTPLRLDIEFYYPSALLHRRDLDNGLKLAIDAICQAVDERAQIPPKERKPAKAWKGIRLKKANDTWVDELHARKYLAEGDGFCQVVLSTIS